MPRVRVSPLGPKSKPPLPRGFGFCFIVARLEPSKWNCPADSSLPPARWRQLLNFTSLAARTPRSSGGRTLFPMARLEPSKWNCPVDSSLPPARWRQLLNLSSLATRTPRRAGGVGFCFLWRDSNHLNGTVRWTVPCRQLDGGNFLISRVSPLGHPAVAGGRTLFPFGEARTIQTELSSGRSSI